MKPGPITVPVDITYRGHPVGAVGVPVDITITERRGVPDWPDEVTDAIVRATVRIAALAEATRVFLDAHPEIRQHLRRHERHRRRIVVVPKKRRKHGRVGVYR